MIAALDEVPAYARVDVICTDGFHELMELELIEPALRFSQARYAAVALADALLDLAPTSSPR